MRPILRLDFDPKRLFLADLNGTGCADLVYVDFDRVHFWFNQSGNRWSDTQTIPGTPRVSDVDSIQFADVFGTGTATLLWSYDYSGSARRQLQGPRFLRRHQTLRPHRNEQQHGSDDAGELCALDQILPGGSSQRHPWVTKLPFPVQVVDKVEVIDHISKTKLVTTYKYHHGYFDGREREFRGFGRVDQFDTETFEDFTGPGLHGDEDLFTNNSSRPITCRRSRPAHGFTPASISTRIPSAMPIGPFDYRELTNKFRKEFYQGDEEAVADRRARQSKQEETPHEAYRALRGAVLRTEVYAHDGSAKAEASLPGDRKPLPGNTTTAEGRQSSCRLFQPSTGKPELPLRAQPDRSAHQPCADTGSGCLRQSAEIDRHRLWPPAARSRPAHTSDRDKQTQTLITYTENSYTNEIDDPILDPDNYRTPLPSESRTYELTGFKPASEREAIQSSTNGWRMILRGSKQAVEIRYEETADLAQTQKRLIEHVRTRYRKNDLS